VEYGGGSRILPEFSAFARGPIREEGKTALVDPAQEHDPGRRTATRGGCRERHCISLWHCVPRLVEPNLKLGDRVVVEVVVVHG